MSIVLPTFSPVAPHSVIDIGHYILESSTGDEPVTLKVDSTLKPGTSNSSVLVRFDQAKNNLSPGLPDTSIAVYTVIRGSLEAFTNAEIIVGLDRVRAVLNDANLTRLRRGEK